MIVSVSAHSKAISTFSFLICLSSHLDVGIYQGVHECVYLCEEPAFGFVSILYCLLFIYWFCLFGVLTDDRTQGKDPGTELHPSPDFFFPFPCLFETRSHYIAHADPELNNPPDSASRGLKLQVCATTPCLHVVQATSCCFCWWPT